MNLYEATNYFLEEESTTPFVIPPKIANNYQITNLADVKNWKGKIYSGNSMDSNKQKVGDWDDILYILVNTKSNEIIPVTRADEHRTGYEFFHDLQSDKKIKTNSQDWISVVSRGNEYFYGNEEDPLKVEAYKKLVQWGLDPTTVTINTPRDDTHERKAIRLDKFLKGESSKAKRVVKEMTPFGKALTQNINAFTAMYRDYLNTTSPITKEQLLKVIRSITWDILNLFGMNQEIIEPADIRSNLELIKRIGSIDEPEDVQDAARQLIGTGGIKNKIHTKLVRSKSPIGKQILGNLSLIDAEFKRLDNI